MMMRNIDQNLKKQLLNTFNEYSNSGLNPIYSAICFNINKGKWIKTSFRGWNRFEKERSSDVFNNPNDPITQEVTPQIGGYYNGIALVCCSSGNLVCFDFDIDSGEQDIYYQEFWRKVGESHPLLKEQAYIEQTRRGGIHVIFQSDLNIEHKPEKPMASFQTGGTLDYIAGNCFLVVAPSPEYKKISGDLTNLHTLTADELDLLKKVAASFNNSKSQHPTQNPQSVSPKLSPISEGLTPSFPSPILAIASNKNLSDKINQFRYREIRKNETVMNYLLEMKAPRFILLSLGWEDTGRQVKDGTGYHWHYLGSKSRYSGMLDDSTGIFWAYTNKSIFTQSQVYTTYDLYSTAVLHAPCYESIDENNRKMLHLKVEEDVRRDGLLKYFIRIIKEREQHP